MVYSVDTRWAQLELQPRPRITGSGDDLGIITVNSVDFSKEEVDVDQKEGLGLFQQPQRLRWGLPTH